MEELTIDDLVYHRLSLSPGIIVSITEYSMDYVLYNVAFAEHMTSPCRRSELITKEEFELKKLEND